MFENTPTPVWLAILVMVLLFLQYATTAAVPCSSFNDSECTAFEQQVNK